MIVLAARAESGENKVLEDEHRRAVALNQNPG